MTQQDDITQRVLTTEKRNEFIRRTSFISEADRDTRAAFVDEIASAALASAPVAGEALNDLQALQWAEKYGIQWALHTPDAIREVIADAQRLAAPQASAEIGVEDAFAGLDSILEVRNAALEQAATAVEARIGVGEPGIDTQELDRETQECANAIRALKTQADKDGPWCCERGEAQGVRVCQECAEISAGYQASMRGDKDGGQQRGGGSHENA
ncbi:hypothetical protein [Achromobacter xylosoxidans]|uniref:hypothetical protein n=1 Tax=Alcaligenes xylosoxydans xylosoxydans TaxID=85698 RepID=UPI0006C2A70B|nr:hypothetical protein [Achromobacter xylosoxidans]CUI53217.1 Uncharacterised protein [Achromobacter xylosoxidans]